MKRELPLTIELIPSSSFMNNVRKAVSRESWDIIRRETYKKYSYHCGICGASNCVLECHEIWEFDDENNIQRLQGLISLCTKCHKVKHFGFALMMADQGKMDIEELLKHFRKVNKCRNSTFQKHFKESVKVWEERSRKEWKLDLGECEKYVMIDGLEPARTQ